jgi:mannose/cellobiose epimerase-like protein (N-acyl-D-glucosamine 2-epimerase family)
MGALVFWVGVGFLVALVLLAARTVDRRDRRRGHYLRSSGEMSRDAWEHRRDAVAGDSVGHLNADRSWTAQSRRVEGRSRPPDERREQ